MGGLARIERKFGRRRWPRHRVGVPARLMLLDSTIPVVLDELSQGGARIVLPEACEFAVGVLRWMDCHAFAEVVWRDEATVGLQFDRPIAAEAVEATVRYAESHHALQGDLRRC